MHDDDDDNDNDGASHNDNDASHDDLRACGWTLGVWRVVGVDGVVRCRDAVSHVTMRGSIVRRSVP